MDEWWFTDWQLPPTWWCSHGTPPLRNQWGWFIRLWSNNVRQRNDDPKGQSPIPLQKVQVMWSSEAWHNGWWNHWSRCLFGSTFSATLEFPFLQAAVNFSWRCRSLIPASGERHDFPTVEVEGYTVRPLLASKSPCSSYQPTQTTKMPRTNWWMTRKPINIYGTGNNFDHRSNDN